MFVCDSLASASSYSFQIIQPARMALADRFYRSHGYKIKCAEQEQVFALVNPAGEFSAAVRLVPQASGHYWLRNLLVDPGLRGNGLASRLLGDSKPVIFPRGCYCFALPHLTGLYQRSGFELNPGHCPNDIALIYERYRNRGRDWVLMGYQQSQGNLSRR